MSLNRKKVCETTKYLGYSIDVEFIGPDYLAVVDGKELPNFYMGKNSAIRAGMRHVDELEKAKKEKKAKEKKAKVA